MQKKKVTIEKITRENYHLFDDIVSWRLNGIELTEEEKEANKNRDFSDVLKELEHPGFFAYGALCDGRFVGWITWIYTPKIGRRRWKKGVIYVDELWTAPEFRRKGIAKQLMKKAFDYQKETGAVEVRLYVGADNVIAQELYKNCGMHVLWNTIFVSSEKQ